MEVTKEQALQVAELFREKVKPYSNYYYITVGFDTTRKEFFADEHPLCPNDRESDNIQLKPGEFLVKVYDKKVKKDAKVLRSDNLILP